MSKLTNMQIVAQIDGLRRRIQADAARGDAAAVRRRQRTLDQYVVELAERETEGRSPGAEIQDRRFGQ